MNSSRLEPTADRAVPIRSCYKSTLERRSRGSPSILYYRPYLESTPDNIPPLDLWKTKLDRFQAPK